MVHTNNLKEKEIYQAYAKYLIEQGKRIHVFVLQKKEKKLEKNKKLQKLDQDIMECVKM